MLEIVVVGFVSSLIGGIVGASIQWFRSWKDDIKLSRIESDLNLITTRIVSIENSVKGQKSILRKRERNAEEEQEDQAMKQLIQQGLGIFLSDGSSEEKKKLALGLLKKNPKAISKLADKYGISSKLGDFL